MKKARVTPKLAVKTAKKPDEIKLEPGESVETITITDRGQEMSLISYCFLHPQFGMSYRIDAPTIDICRNERDLWLKRNDLTTQKRRRRAP